MFSGAFFDEVTVPRLVHWDLRAGNVLVEQERITGLIDFERCLWGDVRMEVGFRTFARDPFFKRDMNRHAHSFPDDAE